MKKEHLWNSCKELGKGCPRSGSVQTQATQGGLTKGEFIRYKQQVREQCKGCPRYKQLDQAIKMAVHIPGSVG